MNESEVRMILAQIAALDNRKITNAMVIMWHGLFRRETYPEVKWAVMEHARNSTEYLTPAHLVAIIQEKRAEHRMMNPGMSQGTDAWLEWEAMQVAAADEARAIRASGVRYAVDAIESGEYDQ